jgi:hypothetical protein
MQLQVVRTFGEDIRTQFGIDKCAKRHLDEQVLFSPITQ